MAWNKNCIHAPVKQTAKHCKATNSGKRNETNPKGKGSGVIGKGYFGCSAKCSFFEVKSGQPTRFVMNEALA